MNERRLRRAIERVLDRLVAGGQWEVLARVASVLPFQVSVSYIELPVVGGGQCSVPVVDWVGYQARLHELMVVCEEQGLSELYRLYEKQLMEAQRAEAEQVRAMAAVMRGEGSKALLEQFRSWFGEG